MENKAVFSKKEFAQQLGVSLDTINRMIKKGEIRVVNFGRRRLIPASELPRVLASAQ